MVSGACCDPWLALLLKKELFQQKKFGELPQRIYDGIKRSQQNVGVGINSSEIRHRDLQKN